MTDPLRIVVLGQPAPQGSKRAFAVRGKGGVPTGRVAVIESSHDRVKSWRQAVIDVASEHNTVGDPGDPLTVRMVFSLKRPKSHYRTGRNSHLLRDNAPAAPSGKPDLSKLARSTEDALTDAGTWWDDAHVVGYERLAKVWCGEDPDALDVPGAVIIIRAITLTAGPVPAHTGCGTGNHDSTRQEGAR